MQIEPATKKLFTVDEYYRIAETGILDESGRTELIGGEILQVSKMGPRHAAAISRCANLFGMVQTAKSGIRVQLPIRLDEFNVPEPDISIVKPRADFYSSGHPEAGDVHLILEIADSSLRYDRDVKGPIYASAGIPEFWIVSLELDIVMVFRNPSASGYRTALTFGRGEILTALAFPDMTIQTRDLLGG